MFIDLRSLWQDYEGNDVARAPTIQLPAKPDRNASALTWVCSTILPLMASVALSAISPAWATQPVSIPKPVYLQHQVTSPNLVLLGSVASNPFKQTSWPNPGKPPAPISEVRGLNLPLVGTVPFTQTSWPNPTKPPGPFSEVRGPNLPLQFVAAAGNPFVQTSWPNPIVPKPLPAPSSFRPVFTSEFQPFYQTQWPNPGTPPGPFSEVRGLNLSLLPLVVDRPFPTIAWPNPGPQKPQPVPSSFRPVFTSEFQPFYQTQWPNPGKPTAPIAEVRGLDLYRLPVVAADRPFVQTNWPNPIPPPRVRLPQPEQYFEAVYKPVMQNDWPLPWYPPPFKHDVIGPNLAVLHDMTNVPHPFVQRDWPLPKLPPVYVHPVGPWPIIALTGPPPPVITDHLLTCMGCGT